jgi:hypothetical protein
MNKNIINKKKPSYIVIIFWSIIALLSLTFIGLLVSKIIDSSKVDSLDKMTNLQEEMVFNQEGTYYVYVYSKVGITENKVELERAEALEETILLYLTYTKRNSEKNKIYGMIVDDVSGNNGNHGRLISSSTNDKKTVGVDSFNNLLIFEEDVPCLFRIKDGKIEAEFLTENDINKELQKVMNPEEK